MGIRLRDVALLFPGCVLAACGFFVEPTPDVANPNHETIAGFSFAYPGNWKATRTTTVNNGFTTTLANIESSGNALFMVQIFEPGLPLDPDGYYTTFMAEVQNASKDELGGLVEVETKDASKLSKGVMGEEWEGRAGSFDVVLLGETVPTLVEILLQVGDDQSVSLISHAPKEDWAKVKPGFDLVLSSFSRSK